MRASPEKKEEKERVRHALLRATLQVAAAHGFSSLGLREVAREAGIAPTSFYRHFADMDELGRAIINEFVVPTLAQLEQAVKEAAGGGQGVPEALVSAAFQAVAQDRELVRFVLAEQAGAFANFRAGLRQKLDVLAQTLQGACSCEPWQAHAAVVVLLDELNRLLEMEGAEAEPARSELRSQALQRLAAQLKARKESAP
ncbi:MAG: TetR family transcriptional regulator [Myxococcales bacterium]